MSEEISLTCKECGYSNEPQRVYCHNCGAKLDRTALPEKTEAQESHRSVQKRVKKLVSPGRGFFAGWKTNLFNAILWSMVAAGLVQMGRAPEDIPKPLSEEERGQYINFVDVLFNAVRTPESQRVSFKEDEANRFLANMIKGKNASFAGDKVKFVRTFVQFEEGTVKVNTHQTIFDYPVYASAWFAVQIKGGTLDARCVGGSVGRLNIHPRVMDYAQRTMRPLWEALKTERNGLTKMKSIEVKKGEFIITTPSVRNTPSAGAPPSN